MLEQCVKTLLADPNLPEPVVAKTIERLLVAYRTAPIADNLLAHSWGFLAREASASGICTGPRAIPADEPIRIAKLMTVDTYFRYYVSPSELFSGSTDLRSLLLDCDESDVSDMFQKLPTPDLLLHQTLSDNRPVWTCQASDLAESSPDVIRDELGLVHFGAGQHLVALEYTVPSFSLRVPTIIDAALQPWFMPKPVGSSSRAWNWVAKRWGMHEFVHSASVQGAEPTVRHIGRLGTDAPSYLATTERLELLPSDRLEAFLDGVLRQVFAHVELSPFLSGEAFVLNISPYDFERFVGALYARAGYKTTVTKASRDGGIDVIAISNADYTDGVLIQAKQVSGSVGISVVRELIGARHLADESLKRYRMAIVSTGRFSRVAKDAEHQNAAELSLHDYASLVRWLEGLRNTRMNDIYFNQVAEAQIANREAGRL